MEKIFKSSKTDPVVTTKQGKLRGFYFNGIYNFRGIAYAKARRFEMPKEPDCWEGTKDALAYGLICPLIQQPVPGDEVVVPHRFWPESEHCQNLQIWTPTIEKDAKRPVMVWFHGGGYSSGSAIEHEAYEGDGLARKYGVVMIGVNHRLNVFGHLDMSAYGEKYHNSKNVGIADLVASLRWVKENIEKFGGDPDNVTIFGQSGGGGKVITLGQTPDADGLFQRAIIMSGVFPKDLERKSADGRDVAAALLSELQIAPENADELQKVPVPVLIMAVKRVEKKFAKLGLGVNWAPSANDWYLGDPMQVGFRKQFLAVPTMVGSCFSEFTGCDTQKEKEEMSADEREQIVCDKYGRENGQKVLGLFRAAYPGKNEAYAIAVDSVVRRASVDFTKQMATEGGKDVYLYLFSHVFDYDNGRSPWHCADIPYCFANSDKIPFCYSVPDREKIEKAMAGSFVSFAKSGDPNCGDIPRWDKVTADNVPTMLIDETAIEQRMNFDNELLACLQKILPPFQFNFHTEDDEEDEGRKWMY